MTIDDKLPVADNGWPVNARQAINGEWWAPLTEKAFAKMNLNYANLEHGMQSEAMRALTGQPVLVQRTKDIDEEALWDHVKSHVGKGNILTASCLKDYNGLVGGHAYTILYAQEVAGEKLI